MVGTELDGRIRCQLIIEVLESGLEVGIWFFVPTNARFDEVHWYQHIDLACFERRKSDVGEDLIAGEKVGLVVGGRCVDQSAECFVVGDRAKDEKLDLGREGVKEG